MALTAGIRELKNRLTHYLRLVRQGERVIVTQRNRPIAVLGPIGDEAGYDSIDERLASLARSGAMRLAEPGQRLPRWKAVRARGKPASRIISDDRDSR